MPDRYMGVHILGGDRSGILVRFPSGWLTEPFNRESFMRQQQNGGGTRDIPRQFLEALRHVLSQLLHEGDLGLQSIAARLGISSQSLQRKLRARDTTLSAVILELKKERAIDQLLLTNRPIGEISDDLGFSNSNSFTRAFKSWTGVSPRAYRNEHRSSRT